jgi:homoserine O-succinyltransferase
MPDAALEATERQFVTLLEAAAKGILVRLSLFALPDVPRNDVGRHRVNRFYSSVEKLWNSQLDGLIVTGREPRTSNLKEEPYWKTLTAVLEWAEHNTRSTVWSCLAAHAALLHLDGIERRKSGEKRCGIFDCVRLSDHPLMAGLSSRVRMPHSRWNDIPEDQLTACGYTVLTQAEDAGADTIVRRRNSLFVFLQGHPEYDPATLWLEYRRDVRRYVTGESETYPSIPRNYFDAETAEALTALRERALCRGSEDILADLDATAGGKQMEHTWRTTAARLYGNWLAYLCSQTEWRSSPNKPVPKSASTENASTNNLSEGHGLARSQARP